MAKFIIDGVDPITDSHYMAVVIAATFDDAIALFQGEHNHVLICINVDLYKYYALHYLPNESALKTLPVIGD